MFVVLATKGDAVSELVGAEDQPFRSCNIERAMRLTSIKHLSVGRLPVAAPSGCCMVREDICATIGSEVL